MMGGEVDLHIHSNRSSDGDQPPKRICELAEKHGMKAISISDHDTMAAYPEVLEFGEKAGIEIVPSIELTTIFDGREFHLLLPFADWRSQVIAELIERVSERRFLEAAERIDRLRTLGFDVSMEEVKARSGSFPPLGVTIAQTLLDKYRGRRHPELEKYYAAENEAEAPYLFYKNYFMEGRPACVPRRNLPLLEVLDVVSGTGGVPVLAHPGAYFQNVTKQDLVLLSEKGIEGLEVFTSYHTAEQTAFYRKIADDLDLVSTAGSDFHGSIKPHIPFASIRDGVYGMVEELNKRRS